MIYYIDHIDTLGDDVIELLLPYVSSERMAYAGRYRFRNDRVQSLLAYILLRIGLYEEYGICHMPKIGISETKKPFLEEYPQIHFNLSHCKNGVACGIADSPLGVDIQHYVEFKDGVAAYFMTPSEIQRAKQGNADVEFTRIWTLKESYGKWSGSGICYDMTKQEIKENERLDGCISQSRLLENFIISVTAAKHMDLLELRTEELLKKCLPLAQRI